MPRNKSIPVPPREEAYAYTSALMPNPGSSEYKAGSHKYSRLVLTKRELYRVASNDLINSDDHVYTYGSTDKYVVDVPSDNAEHLESIILAMNLAKEYEKLTKYYYLFLGSVVTTCVLAIVYAFLLAGTK